jgi:hypothetical protein
MALGESQPARHSPCCGLAAPGRAPGSRAPPCRDRIAAARRGDRAPARGRARGSPPAARRPGLVSLGAGEVLRASPGRGGGQPELAPALERALKDRVEAARAEGESIDAPACRE